jgi:hypothetical protein
MTNDATDGWRWFEATAPGAEDQPLRQAYLRTFATDAGRQVLAHLRSQTIDRSLSPEGSDRALWHLEGQRRLVRMIERLAESNVKEGFRNE